MQLMPIVCTLRLEDCRDLKISLAKFAHPSTSFHNEYVVHIWCLTHTNGKQSPQIYSVI